MAAQGARVGDAEVWPAQEWRAVVQAFESAVRPRRWLLGCTGGMDPAAPPIDPALATVPLPSAVSLAAVH